MSFESRLDRLEARRQTQWGDCLLCIERDQIRILDPGDPEPPPLPAVCPSCGRRPREQVRLIFVDPWPTDDPLS